MVEWTQQTIPGATPNGGILATVAEAVDGETVVITEIDLNGFVVFRHEWQIDSDARSGMPVTLTILDWDEQVVETRTVARMPRRPQDADDLNEMVPTFA